MSLDEDTDNFIILKYKSLNACLSYDEYSKSNLINDLVAQTGEREIEIFFELCNEYTFNKVVQYLKRFKHISKNNVDINNIKSFYSKEISDFFDEIYKDCFFCDKLFHVLNFANYLHIDSLIYFVSYKYGLIINEIPDVYYKDLPEDNEDQKNIISKNVTSYLSGELNYTIEELEVPINYRYLFETINSNGCIIKKRNFDTSIWLDEYIKRDKSLKITKRNLSIEEIKYIIQ